MSFPYRSHRDGRFEHSSDAIDAIVDWNCHGCTVPDKASIHEQGPGGDCDLLIAVAIGDYEPIPDLLDNGRTVRCQRRRVDPPPPPQVETLFEVLSG